MEARLAEGWPGCTSTLVVLLSEAGGMEVVQRASLVIANFCVEVIVLLRLFHGSNFVR